MAHSIHGHTILQLQYIIPLLWPGLVTGRLSRANLIMKCGHPPHRWNSSLSPTTTTDRTTADHLVSGWSGRYLRICSKFNASAMSYFTEDDGCDLLCSSFNGQLRSAWLVSVVCVVWWTLGASSHPSSLDLRWVDVDGHPFLESK